MGYILLLLAQCMVGVCVVASKALLVSMSPVVILAARFIVATGLLLILHFIFSKEKVSCLKKVTGQDWIYILLQSFCAGAAFNILLLWGLQYTSASAAGIVTSALPAMIAICSILFLKERLTFFVILCIVCAVLGLVIINANGLQVDGAHPILGDMIILLALLPEAAYYILAKLYQNKLPIFLIAAIMNGMNVPIFLLWAFVGGYHFYSVTEMAQCVLLVVVGIGSALFYVFWFLGCKNIHGTKAGLTTAFMPIATLLIAWMFLNEKISLLQLVGMGLVILSIVFNAAACPRSCNAAQKN